MSTAEASMSGTVTDQSTGETLSGISVAIFNDSTNQKLTGTTDSSGAYSIQSIPVGTYNVEVEGDDYSPTNVDDLSLPAGNTVKNFTMSKSDASVEPSLDTELRITGTVVAPTEANTVSGGVAFPASNSVGGVTVTVKNQKTGATLGTTTSDSNGNFSVEASSAASSFAITAIKDGVYYDTDNVAVNGDPLLG